MASSLCSTCQALDIRKLLAIAKEQPSTQVKTRLTGFLDADLEWKPGVPDFFPYHTSLAELEKSSRLGCPLCLLTWDCCSEDVKKSIVLEYAATDPRNSQLYIGTSSFTVAKGEVPIIIISQRPVGQSPRTLCSFDIFSERGTFPHEESSYIGMPVSLHSDSEHCKQASLEWFSECTNNHPLCGPSKIFRRPTRLIYVGSRQNACDPELRVNGIPDSVSWAALSYCWGGESEFVLKGETFEILKHGVRLEDFPATLRDSINITRNLGLEYLWIDALCIFQDSADDWRAEAARMRDVYSGAAVTIIAAESVSTRAGIYASRPLIKGTPCKVPWSKVPECHVWLRPSVRNATDASYTNQLQSRGWTLQEGLLSPRTLSFRKDQIVWECSNHRRTESGHTMILDHMFDSKDLFHNKKRKNQMNVIYQDFYFKWCKQVAEFERWKSRFGWLPQHIVSTGYNIQESLGLNPYTRWFEIVFDYSRRNFTKDTDILPALGGVARAFADITKDSYCAGMWESELIQSLCWWRQGLTTGKSRLYEPTNMNFTKPTAYRAPSWSWAGINGGRVTMFNFAVDDKLQIQNIATVIKVHLEPVGQDPYGQLKSGYLRIKGSLFDLGNLYTEYWRSLVPSWENFKHVRTKDLPSYKEMCSYQSLRGFVLQRLNQGGNGTFEFEQQHISHPNQKFGAFVIVHTEGLADEDITNEQEDMKGSVTLLLLESTGTNCEEYRRIGVITLNRPWELSVVESSIHRVYTRHWKELSKDQWEKFGDIVKSRKLVRTVLEAKAWIEVAKNPPKKATIRII
ncbi:heterokaryon incompatibility protein-domain-containing protein [Xylogone sp. PMI_703]|nr:heterokaryon incompatibility protein-domain-containing protein [Xylogone sp. PMI_703]